MKTTKSRLRHLIREELKRLSFAKGHEYGVDVIPHAKQDKAYDDIIGHT